MNNFRLTVLSFMVVVAVFSQEFEVFTEGKQAEMYPRALPFRMSRGKRSTGIRFDPNASRTRMSFGKRNAYGSNEWNEYLKENTKRMDMRHDFVGLGNR
uniref:Neuropeptide n=1 Tax=Haemonchus contortus TaxID=6289 RepID=A0A7I4Z447_HAECO|nr:unnamed protein product [Haemonchus contortus]